MLVWVIARTAATAARIASLTIRANNHHTVLSIMSLKPSSLLQQLRKEHYAWQDHPEQGLDLLVKHQSEFPARIREAIQDVSHRSNDEDTTQMILVVFAAVRSFLLCEPPLEETVQEGETPEWRGPDIEIDTRDEIEVAIRFFPKVLRETRPIDQIWEWDFYPIFWITTCLKSLPFVPLIAELGNEYQMFEDKEQGGILNIYQIRKGSPLLQIITSRFILANEPVHSQEFYRRVDDISLSILVDLKEKGFVRKKDAWDCIKNLLNEPPSLTSKRLEFFLDWDPSMFLLKDNYSVELFQRRFGTSLMNEFLKQCGRNHNTHIMLERFRTLFELGLKHYPKQLGFLFHDDQTTVLKPSCRMFGDHNEITVENSYRQACYIFGEEPVDTAVKETLLECARAHKGDSIPRMIHTAATNQQIIVDGLFILGRRDPTALVALFGKVNTSGTVMPTMEAEKTTIAANGKINILLVLICTIVAGLVRTFLRNMTSTVTGEL